MSTSNSTIPDNHLIWVPVEQTVSGASLGSFIVYPGVGNLGWPNDYDWNKTAEWLDWYQRMAYPTFPAHYFTVLKNDDKEIVLTIDVPGLKREHLEIRVLNGNLDLQTSSKSPRVYSSTHFVGGVNSVVGKLEDGVLTITCTKVSPLTIKIL